MSTFILDNRATHSELPKRVVRWNVICLLLTIAVTQDNSILYIPPVVKPLTNVTVIEEGTVSVVCVVTAGVPSKNDFRWDRMSDMTKVSMEQTLSIANIDRKQAGYYKCTASNNMEPTGHDAVVGAIPPVVKPLTNGTVIEEGTVSVVCEKTAGVPSKNDFRWDRMSDMTKVSMEQTLSIANIDRKQAGYYKCTASNIMEPTGHDTVVGAIPPVVKPLTNVTVIEEGTVSVVCEITAGVPSKNDFQWERMSDSSKVSMEQTLIFANIDRKQTGYYKCTASNNMEPTGHDAVVGARSNTVYVDVQCKSNTEISLI
ncbi:NTRI-like protein [Mya arenaria]|uniref:NTRI-like protein n=1 Tax=Mya arenaria TaxID=6604 RepID=A0ABY7EPD5_MYAAR|nr:NTRI-like protein [Mya arenaria]